MAVGGALTQLAAQGPQNRYITIDPQVTLWKGTYKRVSMFAVAEIDNTFQGATGCGRKMTALVNRSGDLIWKTYFYFQAKPIEYSTSMVNDGFVNNVAYYTNSLGHAIIESVNYEVGGHCFDEHSGEFLEIWEQLTATHGKTLGEQIGHADSLEQLIEYGKKTQHIYTPLVFDFNRHTEHAMPLIALQYHDVKFNIRTKRAEELIIRSGEANNPATLAQPGEFCDMTLIINYVFLDAMERRMFAQQMHEYLVDQVQHSGSESHTAGTTSHHLRLVYNHPSIELMWVFQRDSAIIPTPYTGVGTLAGGGGNDWFNWSGNHDSTTGVVYSPFISTEIQLNGHSRTLDHPSIYYTKVHPRERHTRTSDSFVHNYSFAVYPEDKQPSGSCNLYASPPLFLPEFCPFMTYTLSPLQQLEDRQCCPPHGVPQRLQLRLHDPGCSPLRSGSQLLPQPQRHACWYVFSFTSHPPQSIPY
jgi:hypothetical protein